MKKILLLFTLIFSVGLTYAQTPNADQKKAEILAVFAEMQKYTDNLGPDDLNELPIGIKRTISNIEYTVAITSAVFHQDYAELTAYAQIRQVQGQILLFGVSGLKFSYEGGIVGDARLALLGDFSFPLPGKAVTMTMKGGLNIANGQIADNSTYITIDCKGFKELFLNADLEFSKNIFIPCNEKGEKIPDQLLKTNFQIQVSNANDLLVAINLPKFQIKGLEDFVFTVRNAAFDFSDTRNEQSITFPAGYVQKYVNFPNPNMWRGVYIKEIEVLMPKAFQKRNSTDRIGFGSRDMLVDNNGVTGNFFAKGILPLTDGTASGWAFSVDEFSVNLEANSLTAAQFNGAVMIPLAEKEPLKYNAIITADNKYELTIAPMEKLTFDLWQAKVVLDNNSYLKMRLENDKFLPEANLNGYMNLGLRSAPEDTSKKAIAMMDQIRFQNLHLQTHTPYLQVEYFGYNGEISIGNLPASITEISLSTRGTDILSLNIGAKVTLMEKQFSAETRLGIETKIKDEEGKQHWKFERLRFDKIALSGDMAGMKLDGSLEIMDGDPTYGNGFKGQLMADFKSLNVKVETRAIFGKKDFSYWFFYGKAEFPSIGSGFFNINGFSGGAYYRMRRMPDRDDYIPDETMGLGVRAGLLFNITSRSVADCMAEFEMSFNRNNSLRYIGFFGSAKMMGQLPIGGSALAAVEGYSKQINDKMSTVKVAELEKLTAERERSPQKAAENAAPAGMDPKTMSGIAAYVAMSYDFNNKTFHSTFDAYVNVAGGLLRGVNPNNHAGTAVAHIDPNEWYIHVGTPTVPMGVMLGIGSLSVKSTSYFMAGTSIPEPPAPPQEVTSILGMDAEKGIRRNNSLLAGGRGIAFGTGFSLNTGDITFLILYANLKAGLGFDITMTEQKDVFCKGSSEPIGIDGWYATGQAYAYLAGEIGVKVDLKFVKGRFPIIQGGAAALMQAKLPNPTFMKGTVGVQYNILGGLVKGNSKFEVTFGQDCEMEKRGESSPVGGINMIADIMPKEGTETDVFNSPQVAFNFAVGTDFVFPDENGNDKYFKVVLEKYELSSKGQKLQGELKWNNNKDRVTFNSHEVLPPKSTIQLAVEVSFQEKKGNTWQTIYNNGQVVKETKTITFTTSDAPNEVPLNNIEFCYPVVAQRNFYKGETNQGYVQLKKGQSYLFNIQGQVQRLALQPSTGGNSIETDFSYNSSDRRLAFTLPQMNTAKEYKLSIVSKLPQGSIGVTTETKNIQKIGEADDYVEITQNTAQSVSRTDVGIVLLSYDFRTSAHETFAAKINSMRVANYNVGYINYRLCDLRLNTNSYEPFDLVELIGNEYTANKPLVNIESDLQDSRYKEYMYPHLYQHIPYPEGVTISNRDVSIYGTPPAKAFIIKDNYVRALESEDYASSSVTQQFPYIYALFTSYENDYYDIGNQLANKFLGRSNNPDYINYLLQWGMTSIPAGIYGTKLQYKFPNQNNGSTANLNYKKQ